MKSTGIVEEWKWEEYGRQNQEQWSNGMLEHWENGVLEYWNDGMLEEWKDGGKEIPPGLPLAKGGDKAKRGNKNEGRLMSCRFRKEGSMGKAGENWGT
jgi:hypothetical protein